MEDSVYVSREDLYAEVWTTPVQRLAVKYGISDVALGKICKKLSVPKPPRGYWARVAAGNTPKRTPLLKLRPGQRPGVYISPSHYETYKFKADASTLETVKKIKESGITVPQALDQPHKLIRMARRHLRRHKPEVRNGLAV